MLVKWYIFAQKILLYRLPRVNSRESNVYMLPGAAKDVPIAIFCDKFFRIFVKYLNSWLIRSVIFDVILATFPHLPPLCEEEEEFGRAIKPPTLVAVIEKLFCVWG